MLTFSYKSLIYPNLIDIKVKYRDETGLSMGLIHSINQIWDEEGNAWNIIVLFHAKK